MHNLNQTQLETLTAAANGDLYRTTLGNYKISNQNGLRPSAYGLELAGLLERSGEMGAFLNHRAHLVEGETIRPTPAGLEALNALGVDISKTAAIGASR